MPPCDAFLLVSFGGPERPEDVLPFLENVVSGKNVPKARLLAVAKHYELFGGVSPINAANRALLAALVAELDAHGSHLPVYWGNLHWHPLLADSLRQMADDGIQRALTLATSAFGSYPGCRQYLEAIERARAEVGQQAPRVDKLRLFYNHPDFIEALAERVTNALEQIPAERRSAARLICTAHSIPQTMARTSPYERQLREACRLVAERVGKTGTGSEPKRVETNERVPGEAPVPVFPVWDLVYQSRSGPPSQPWLGPDIGDHLRELAGSSEVRDVVLVPIGFLCEHMEVVYDLDVEAAAVCKELGLNMVRSGLAGCHPRFVRMIRELIEERLSDQPTRLALGADGPWPDRCLPGCYLPE